MSNTLNKIPPIPIDTRKDRKVLTEAQIKKMRRLRIKGWTYKQLAEYFDVKGLSTIGNYLNPDTREKANSLSYQWKLEHKDVYKVIKNRIQKKVYQKRKELFPVEVKEYYKDKRDEIGREYFRKKYKEFLERNPGYQKKYQKKYRRVKSPIEPLAILN